MDGLYRANEHGGSPSPPKQGEIINSLARIEGNVERLHKTITQLSDRINHILQPDDQTGGAEEKAKNPSPSCELVGLLGKYNNGVDDAIRRINNIIERCEL